MNSETILKNKIALFAPIESDLKDINTKYMGYRRLYEQEAVKCFKCWRANGGWLSDIPIYAICPTKSTISSQTKEIFADLGITYIEEYFPETELYDCGFWNIPLVGRWAENNLTEDILIKIDLDMYLLQELPREWFNLSIMNSDIVGLHDSEAHEYLRTLKEQRYKYFFNTGLTITNKTSKFFADQYETLSQLSKDFKGLEFADFKAKYQIRVSNKKDEILGKNNFEYCLLEELAVSFMFENGRAIIPVTNYYLEAGEYELHKLRKFNNKTVYFIHEHLDDSLVSNNLQNKIKYLKFFKNLKGYNYFLSLTKKRRG